MIHLTLPTNIDDHDHRTEELFSNHSLEALVWLIDAGRELEFTFHGAECFISRSGSAQYVSLWCRHSVQSFPNMESLLHDAVLDGVPFLDAWDYTQLDYLL